MIRYKTGQRKIILVKQLKMYGSEIPAIQVSSMTIKEKGTTFVTN